MALQGIHLEVSYWLLPVHLEPVPLAVQVVLLLYVYRLRELIAAVTELLLQRFLPAAAAAGLPVAAVQEPMQAHRLMPVQG